MSSFNGKINLMSLRNAGVATIKGETAKRCIVIPISDNFLYVSTDDDQKVRSVYLDFTAWENETPGKFGDTHRLRLALPKEAREKMSEDERRTIPYIGNMKPVGQADDRVSTAEVPEAEVVESDDNDLPW